MRLKQRISLNDQVRNPVELAKMGLQWMFAGSGPLTVGAGQVGGAACTEYAVGGRPDVQFNVMPLSVDKPGDPLHSYSGFTASVWQCHGKSRGSLAIRSTDPFDQPRIEPNYFAEDIDRKTMVAGLQMLREIYRQKSFRDLWDIEMVPGEAVESSAGLWDFARTTGGTVFHCVGTCRMGNDAGSVLDPQLRVRGVETAPRDRCLGDAADHVGQYQCEQPDDRGAGRRPRDVVEYVLPGVPAASKSRI